MGCGGSKVDDLPLVILCRERKQLIKAASDHRLALAAAHLSYFHSLHDVGDAIRKFVDEELVLASAATNTSSSSPGSPVLTLPPRDGGKSKPKSKSKSTSSSTSISHSVDGDSYHDHNNNRSAKVKNNNKKKNHHHQHQDHHHHHYDDDDGDSHLHLSSSDSDLDSDSGHSNFHHHHENPEREEEFRGPMGSGMEPSTSYGDFNNYPAQGNWGYGGYTGEPIPPSNPYPYSDPYANPYPYPAPYSNPYPDVNPYNPTINPYPNQNMYYMKKSTTPAKTVVVEDPSASNGYWGSGSYYGNGAGYFGGYQPPPMREPSPQKPPPAPPSPPRASTWDFLNVFESVDNGGAGGGGFHGYHTSDRYVYGSITSSPDSREVREREGIPDLEDETEHEVIKEVPREKKRTNEERSRVNNNNGKSRFNEEFLHNNYGEGTSKPVAVDTSSSSIESIESSMRGRRNSSKGKGIKTSMSPDTIPSPGSIVSMSPPQEEELVKRKKGVSFEVVEEAASSVAMDVESEKPNISMMNALSAHGTRDIQEVVKEIRDEFETATNYGKEIAFMLEVNKLPYQRQTTPLKVSLLRILSMKAQAKSSVQISSRVMKIAKMYSEQTVNEFDIHPVNLSSTLAKLYAWEKKLYKEVKEEERLRVIYEKECKRLKLLDDRGEESSKIEATQDSIRKLMTKLNVCVRAVDSISVKIHKLRDEELQPQITALIHGLIRMWRSMLRCHQKQFQAIMESKVRSLKANTLQRDSGLKATLELEMELVDWCSRFNNWIKTQKSYVESLNKWLLKCINQELEETADGVAPFSPSRIGAPPIFVICNDWYEGMLRVSEKGVENAMLDFASNLQQLWERQDQEQRQRIKTEYLKKDLEKQLKTLRMERGKRSDEKHERDAGSSDKAVSKVPSDSGVSPLDDLKVDLDSMRKKLDEERARHKETAKLVHDAASSSLQAGLLPIFEALGSFTSEILKVHEDVRLVEGTF